MSTADGRPSDRAGSELGGTERSTYVLRPGAQSAHDLSDAWGRIAWLADGAQHGVGATVGFVEILAGEANPLHVHANCSEILVLLEGSLSHVVGEETVELVAGDVLVVPPGMVHRAANDGTTTARMVVVYDSGSREFETVE